MKKGICIAIIGKNCGNVAARLNKSALNFNEKIYVDDHSTDKSAEIFEKYGFRVFKRHLNGDFSSQRNFVLENSESDWIFFLDSDEKIEKSFYGKALSKIEEGKYNGFKIRRKVYFVGKLMKGTEMGNDYVVRLANKRNGKWSRKVHEIWNIDGEVGELDSPIYHYTALYLSGFIDKIGNYHKLHVSAKVSSGEHSSIAKILLNPPAKFIDNFYFQKGYRDESYGLVVSILMSFHSFLSWSHLWLTRRK